MTDKIIEALSKLDPANDEHWTADGAPKIDALGIEGVKRADIVKAAPHFTRSNPAFETPAQAKAREEVAIAQKAEQSALEKASAKVDAAGKKVTDLEKQRQTILVELQKAMAEQDMANRELAALQGNRTSQHDIMDYLAAVRAENAKKAEAALAAKEARK